jgi:hypothetical protein
MFALVFVKLPLLWDMTSRKGYSIPTVSKQVSGLEMSGEDNALMQLHIPEGRNILFISLEKLVLV